MNSLKRHNFLLWYIKKRWQVNGFKPRATAAEQVFYHWPTHAYPNFAKCACLLKTLIFRCEASRLVPISRFTLSWTITKAYVPDLMEYMQFGSSCKEKTAITVVKSTHLLFRSGACFLSRNFCGLLDVTLGLL